MPTSIITDDQLKSLIKNIPGIIYQCAFDKHWTVKYINDGIESLTGYQASDLINNKIRSFASIIHPDDVDMVEKVVNTAVKQQREYIIEYRLVNSQGQSIWVYEKGCATYNEDGTPMWLDGFIIDIARKKRNELLEVGSKRVLEHLVAGTSIHTVLETLALSIEQLCPHMICSILILDNDGRHLRHGGSPSLPDFYNEATDGLVIGKHVGSCGAAAFSGKPCIIGDISTHPNCPPPVP